MEKLSAAGSAPSLQDKGDKSKNKKGFKKKKSKKNGNICFFSSLSSHDLL